MIYFNNYNSKGIFSNVLLFVLGLLLVVIPADTVLSIIFTLLGLTVILINIIPCIMAWSLVKTNKGHIPFAIYQSLTLVVGILIIALWDNSIMAIILGIYLVILPLIRIIQTHGKKLDALIKEIPYLFFGLLLFFIPLPAILGIMIRVIGVIVMIYSLAIIIIRLTKKNNDDDDFNNNDGQKKFKDDRVIIDAEYKDIK